MYPSLNGMFDGIHPVVFELTDNKLKISVRYNNFIIFNLIIRSYFYHLQALILYPARFRRGTYRGCCSKRDEARTSVKTGSWTGRTHSQ